MTLSRPALRALAAAGAVALLLAACGGDGDDDAEATTTTSAPAATTEQETTTTTEADRKGGPAETTEADDPDEPDEPEEGDDPDALAVAESVILTAEDVGSDWEAESSDDRPGDDELTDCFTDTDVEAATLAEVDSDTFSLDGDDGDTTVGVASTGLVVEDEDTAEAILDEAGTNGFAGCALDQLLASFEESGLTVEDSDLDPAPGVGTQGDQTAVLNGFFTISDGTQTYEGELSLWFVRTGEVITGASVIDIGETDFALIVDQVAELVGQKHSQL